jgi:DNA-binding IclR family transcriptional regulator
MKTRTYAAPALERGLDILEALARARRPLTQAELARELDRSAGELFRMLACLEQRGYLRKDPDGRFGFSLRLYALAHAQNPVEALARSAAAPMQALASAVRESCHLGVLQGDELRILAQAHGPSPVRLSIEPGSLFPALRTASGRLLAAQLDTDTFRRTFPGASRAGLETARRAGCLAARDQTLRGVHDLSVCIPLPGGHAALALSWLAARGGADKSRTLLGAARGCAAEITRRMGLQGSET